MAYTNIYELFDSQADTMIQKLRSNLDAWAASQANNAINAAALQKIYQLQADLIIKDKGEPGSDKVQSCFSNIIDLFCSAPVVEVFYREGYPA
jgi:hypothetical protein